MAKVQGPRDKMMYFRLDKQEAADLKALADADDRPVADITRRAVMLYLHGGAEKWAEAQAANERDPLADSVVTAMRGDVALAEAMVELAAAAHERHEARIVLLALARLVAPSATVPRRRAKGSAHGAGKE